MSLAIKYAARSRRMNLAKRLDDLARQKAALEADEESDDEYQQADWPVRQSSRIAPSRGQSQSSRMAPRQVERDEDEEEEMDENEVDDEMEEDESQISSNQGKVALVAQLVRALVDLIQGRVVKTGLRSPRVSAKLYFRYESCPPQFYN